MFKRILAFLLMFTIIGTVAPSLDNASASGTSYYVKINSGSLNVRKSASTKATVVTKLAKNQEVKVHSQAKGWAKVTANGKQGYVSSQYIAPKTTAKKSSDYHSKAIAAGKQQLGVKYRYGGTTPSGFDCSGFISYSYKKAGVTLPRTAAEMHTKGKKVSKLEPGDLVFYATSGGKKVTHVSMYIGNGQVIHSTTSSGVSITSMNNSYWKARYIGAKRI
ncbi:C40 family peptidase [Mesobacillus maritimus]|uniref:C40 family peptidase n=1 Tax=Mesobacillus maritimus TaxID=1643336 RepID=UPI00203E8655|nr:SH3 domain-containing C40 family peptidase [Mesobacillus maritimus]MCM3668215.1 C40 family peptidase [Mesobacillus maritimus]